MDNALYRSPITNPRHVLDIATGTGIWAIQFAKLHPEATVVGTDLSLIQPGLDSAPPNVSFVREDSEKDEWVFAAPFDFVYLRFVLSCFDDHRAVMRKAFDAMRPGGWIELLDPTFELLCTDGTTEGTGIKRWADLILQSGPVVGRDFLVAKNYKRWLLEIGFVDVVEEVLPCPSEISPPRHFARLPTYRYHREHRGLTFCVTIVNHWPSDPKFRDVGRWEMLNAEKGVRGVAVSDHSPCLPPTFHSHHPRHTICLANHSPQSKAPRPSFYPTFEHSSHCLAYLLTENCHSGSCSGASDWSHRRLRTSSRRQKRTSGTPPFTDSFPCEYSTCTTEPLVRVVDRSFSIDTLCMVASRALRRTSMVSQANNYFFWNRSLEVCIKSRAL